MKQLAWNRFGPREKQILSILRREGSPLTVREVLERLRREDGDLAYTTVGTVLDRLEGKDVVSRTEEAYGGSSRYRYRFDAADYRRPLVEGAVSDVEQVLGDPGVDLLAEVAAETRTNDTGDNDRTHD